MVLKSYNLFYAFKRYIVLKYQTNFRLRYYILVQRMRVRKHYIALEINPIRSIHDSHKCSTRKLITFDNWFVIGTKLSTQTYPAHPFSLPTCHCF